MINRILLQIKQEENLLSAIREIARQTGTGLKSGAAVISLDGVTSEGPFGEHIRFNNFVGLKPKIIAGMLPYPYEISHHIVIAEYAMTDLLPGVETKVFVPIMYGKNVSVGAVYIATKERYKRLIQNVNEPRPNADGWRF